jgi:hypothetical protein
MSNDINALRSVLFDTMNALSSKDNPMDLDRAKAIADVAQVVINSAKVEVEFMRLTGAQASNFIGTSEALPNGPKTTPTQTGMKTVDGATTTHRLRG